MAEVKIPLSLYIHIPWCIRKCPYCDFNSHQLRANADFDAYNQHLIKDLEQDLCLSNNRPLESIFFGGGTPSLMSAKQISNIITAIKERCELSENAEITLELNPGTIEHDSIAAYVQAGINRISIGVQSFNPQHLKVLGRIHSTDEAHNAIIQAKAALNSGLNSFNVDLMYALPKQSIEEAMGDLRIALNMGIPHLSWYNLTIEEGTAFYKKKPTGLKDDEHAFNIQEAGASLINSYGLSSYEISAWSKAGEECRHNINYWQFGDYLGIGAGAHSKISSNSKIQRLRKHKSPNKYAKTYMEHQWFPDNVSLEFMLNALRLTQGFSHSLYEERSFRLWQAVEPKIIELSEQGLIYYDNKICKTTSKGRNFLSELLEHFV